LPDEITDDFANSDLGDPRRAKRLPKLTASLAQAPSESISAASGGWGDLIAAFRFLNNELRMWQTPSGHFIHAQFASTTKRHASLWFSGVQQFATPHP
jgi:hypothetical protein